MVMEKLTLKSNAGFDEFSTYAVESNIMSLDGVKNIELDAGIEIAKITIDNDKVSKKDIEDAAKKAGFSVTFQ